MARVITIKGVRYASQKDYNEASKKVDGIVQKCKNCHHPLTLSITTSNKGLKAKWLHKYNFISACKVCIVPCDCDKPEPQNIFKS